MGCYYLYCISFSYALKMEIKINNSADIIGTLETSFLDGSKSTHTHNDELYFDNNVTTSNASDNVTVEAKESPLTEIPPVETAASSDRHKEEIKSSVIFINFCSYIGLVLVIALVVGLMLIPLILYFISLPAEDTTLSIFNLLDHQNCLVSCTHCWFRNSITCNVCTPSILFIMNLDSW